MDGIQGCTSCTNEAASKQRAICLHFRYPISMCSCTKRLQTSRYYLYMCIYYMLRVLWWCPRWRNCQLIHNIQNSVWKTPILAITPHSLSLSKHLLALCSLSLGATHFNKDPANQCHYCINKLIWSYLVVKSKLIRSYPWQPSLQQLLA